MAYTHCKILQYDLQLPSVAVVQRRTGPVSLITRFLPTKCWRTGACEHTAHHSDHVLEEKKSALGYFCHITPKVTSRPQNNKWDDFSEWWYKIKGLCARTISHFPELICFIRKRLPGNWLFKNSVNGISVHLYLRGVLVFQSWNSLPRKAVVWLFPPVREKEFITWTDTGLWPQIRSTWITPGCLKPRKCKRECAANPAVHQNWMAYGSIKWCYLLSRKYTAVYIKDL